MRIVLLTFVTCLGFGCATANFNYYPESIDISEPPLDSTNTSFVGDVLLRQGTYAEHDAILIKEKVDIGFTYDLLPGYYLKQGEDEKTETFLPSGGEGSGEIKKSLLADPWRAMTAYKEQPKLCVITVFSVRVCQTTSAFERTKRPSLQSDSFQQTLIYSGKVGNKINVGYREFSNSNARPAFNNDVEYDLDESNVIGYKGARLQIIEANNESITYRVLSNFNQAIR